MEEKKEKKEKKVLEKKKIKLGRPSTLEGLERTSLSLSAKELENLKKRALEERLSVSQYLRDLINAALKSSKFKIIG